MIKKVFVLLLLPLMVELLVSCCDCTEPDLFRYTNEGLTVQHLDNRGREPVVSSDNIVLKKAYGLRVTITGKQVVRAARPSFFISRSYAFSCGCDPSPQYHPIDSVLAFRIITLDDFDVTHPAGADITSYFKVFRGNGYADLEGMFSHARVVYRKPDLDDSFNALLMEPPPQSGHYRFRVEVELSDGRLLQAETSAAELL